MSARPAIAPPCCLGGAVHSAVRRDSAPALLAQRSCPGPHSAATPLPHGGRPAGERCEDLRAGETSGRWSVTATHPGAASAGAPGTGRAPDDAPVTAAGRVLAVLGAFGPAHEWLTLSELSRR